MYCKKLSVLILLLFSLIAFGQERFDSLEVQLNRRWFSNQDSIQVLITTTYGDFDWKVVAIYLDKKGEWHSKLTTTVTISELDTFTGKYSSTETSTNYELIPKSNWTRQGKLVKRRVELSIPKREKPRGYTRGRCCGCTISSVLYRTKDSEKRFGVKKKLKYWLLNKSVRQGYKIRRIEKKFRKSTRKYGT